MNSLLIITLLLLLVAMSFSSHANEHAEETVMLVHGLGRTSLSMKAIEFRLKRAGYRTIQVSYPSRKFCVEDLSEIFLRKAVEENVPTNARKVHFVTHSMGGILLRDYLSRHSIQNLGSILMMAPPNQGSELVDRLKQTAKGRWILGPAGCQLGTASTDLPRMLGPIDFELGVIAGNRSFNPYFSNIIPGDDDGKVSVESTRVSGMKEFLIVSSSHTWMMWRPSAIRLVENFLKTGSFASKSSPGRISRSCG